METNFTHGEDPIDSSQSFAGCTGTDEALLQHSGYSVKGCQPVPFGWVWQSNSEEIDEGPSHGIALGAERPDCLDSDLMIPVYAAPLVEPVLGDTEIKDMFDLYLAHIGYQTECGRILSYGREPEDVTASVVGFARAILSTAARNALIPAQQETRAEVDCDGSHHAQ